MKVRIFGYKGVIIFDPVTPIVADIEFIPAGNSQLGNTLMNTEKNLGISDEALELLKQIQPGDRAIGDVMWDDTMFGWYGTSKNLKFPHHCKGDRDYKIGTKFIRIENEVPEEVKKIIDEFLEKKK